MVEFARTTGMLVGTTGSCNSSSVVGPGTLLVASVPVTEGVAAVKVILRGGMPFPDTRVMMVGGTISASSISVAPPPSLSLT